MPIRPPDDPSWGGRCHVPVPRKDAAMRLALTLVLFLVSVMTLRADTFIYVSMAPEQKVRVYRLDPKEGTLADVETVAVEGAPGSLAVDPRKQFLIASLRSNSALASFRIDPAT